MVKFGKKLRANAGKKHRNSVRAGKKAKNAAKLAKITAQRRKISKIKSKSFAREAFRTASKKSQKKTGTLLLGCKGPKKQESPSRGPKISKWPEKKGITITAKDVTAPARKAMSKELEVVLAKAEARHWLIELGGENSLDVIKNLSAMSNDEELAKKLKIKVSDVRASLNKMHNEGLVAYVRDKNSETGWYSYSWVLNEERIKRWVEARHAQHDAYKPQEGLDFYFCKDCGPQSVLRFEDASEHSFRCPACSSAMDFLDTEKFEQIRKAREIER